MAFGIDLKAESFFSTNLTLGVIHFFPSRLLIFCINMYSQRVYLMPRVYRITHICRIFDKYHSSIGGVNGNLSVTCQKLRVASELCFRRAKFRSEW